MQSADVAVSLLTGFGAENEGSGDDVDDKRRMKRLDTVNIGSNRAKNVGKAKKQEVNDRIQKEIERCRAEIDKRASSSGNGDSNSPDEIQDMKEMISATFRAAKNERLRKEQLRKGGGDAARILADERKEQTSIENEDNNEVHTPTSIKPGEASIVSSFSCLHPSVDGIDAVLREGIATAASALATQQGIGLHSLMSCFHLATLYRDGFRYGKRMWNAELFFYQVLETARSKASCTPRPRLPSFVSDRPPKSMFQFASIFGVVSQAIIHISCMALSIRYTKSLEANTRDNLGKEKIELKHVLGLTSLKLSKLVDSLSKRSLLGIKTTEKEKNSNPFFQRPPFRPNYETNSVFIFSILQSAISALVSHQGAPFYRNVLESRDLVITSGITLLFVVVCITGNVPSLLYFLEIKPLPSGHAKLVFLGIVVINIIGCVFCRLIVDNFLSTNETSRFETLKSGTESQLKNAADYEEKLLFEEKKNNLRTLRFLGGSIVYLMVDMIVSLK